MIKLINPTLMYKEGEVIDVLSTQIQIGRLPDCYLRYGDDFRSVSRLHAIITKTSNGIKLTKPHELNNQIIVNGKEMKVGELVLENNTTVQFSINGPQIIIPYLLTKEKKEETARKNKVDLTKILMYMSFVFLLIAIIILVVTIIKYL